MRSAGARRRGAARRGRRDRHRRRLRSRGRRRAAGSVAGRSWRRQPRRDRRRCAGTTRPQLETSGSTARRRISSPKCCASAVSARWSAEHRAKGRVGPLPGHPRIENQQRRTVAALVPIRPASAPSGRCSTAPPSARPRAPSGGSRRRSASRAGPTAPAPAGRWARRTSAARGDATQSISSCHAAGASSCAPRSRAIAMFGTGRRERTRGDGSLDGVTTRLRRTCGSGSAVDSWSSAATRSDSVTTQVTVLAGSPTTRRLA